MTDIQIYAGTLTASETERSATGLLVPFGEECASNLGRFRVDTGAFSIPDDVTGLSLTIEHEREQVAGGVSKLTHTDQGVVATFSFANTPQGDQALADARTGKRRNLSAEVADVVISAGKAISGRIFGASLVKAGAFPSATLLAAATDTDITPAPPAADEPQETTEKFTDELTDAQGKKYVRTVTRTTRVEPDGDGGTKTTITEKSVIEEPAAPAETEEEPVGTATVPSTLTASAAGISTKKDFSANDVFDMMTKVMAGEDTAGTLLAALTDIKISGAGTLPVGGTAVQPAWLGEVFSAKSYERRYIPLIRNGSITAIDEKGFSIAAGAEPVQVWAGNKAELPSASGTTASISSVFQRWGVANDIAREFYDIPAGRPVIEAYIRLLVNSYARVTDKWTLGQLYAAAGAPVAAEVYPAQYNAAIGKLIQAIDLVDTSDTDPTWAVVAPDLFKLLRFTPKDLIPEYVTFSVSRDGATADGSVTVVRDKTGTLAAGQVLAGSGDVAHVNELPGATPMQLDALDIARGGIDKAVIGYTQYMTEYPAGLKLVGVAP